MGDNYERALAVLEAPVSQLGLEEAVREIAARDKESGVRLMGRIRQIATFSAPSTANSPAEIESFSVGMLLGLTAAILLAPEKWAK